MSYSFYYPPKNKVLVARNAKFLENSLITQEASGSLEDLEIIQEEDTHPSIDTSLNHEEYDLEIDEPQRDIIPIRRSTRTRHAPDRMCLYIDAEEHELRDLGEPANYKAVLLNHGSDKWLNAMNVEMQSMKDNEDVSQLCSYFNGYKDNPKITKLGDKFKNIKQIMKSHVFFDFSSRNITDAFEETDKSKSNDQIVLDIHKKYEKKLAAHQGNQDDDKDIAVPEAGFNFRGIISSCFEPHLMVYVEFEEKTPMDNLEKLIQEETWEPLVRANLMTTHPLTHVRVNL
nr:membrane trafficking VPS53 family protein [Tanacetum cinerariifolium]